MQFLALFQNCIVFGASNDPQALLHSNTCRICHFLQVWSAFPIINGAINEFVFDWKWQRDFETESSRWSLHHVQWPWMLPRFDRILDFWEKKFTLGCLKMRFFQFFQFFQFFSIFFSFILTFENLKIWKFTLRCLKVRFFQFFSIFSLKFENLREAVLKWNFFNFFLFFSILFNFFFII